MSEPVDATEVRSPKTAVSPLVSDVDLLQQVLGHDDALNLVSSLVDLGGAPEEA